MLNGRSKCRDSVGIIVLLLAAISRHGTSYLAGIGIGLQIAAEVEVRRHSMKVIVDLFVQQLPRTAPNALHEIVHLKYHYVVRTTRVPP